MNAAQRAGMIDDAGIVVTTLGEALAERYGDLVHEPLPQSLLDLLHALDARESSSRKGRPRRYRLSCDNCGAKAEVVLETIDPSTLDLRCLACSCGRITVS